MTQIVDHTGGAFAYPITADPKIFDYDFYTSTCVKFSKSETKAIAKEAPAVGRTIVPFVSTFCGKIKVLYGVALCAAIVSLFAYTLGKSFTSASKKGKCIEVHFGRRPLPPCHFLQRWKTVKC